MRDDNDLDEGHLAEQPDEPSDEICLQRMPGAVPALLAIEGPLARRALAQLFAPSASTTRASTMRLRLNGAT